jgi:hypothetical protein
MSNYKSLEIELENFGVDLNCIRINQTPLDSTFCILNYGNKIEVFFFERGIKFDLETFDSNDEAIKHFKDMILPVPFVYKKFTGNSK